MQRRKLDLLVLQLQLGAGDGGLELTGGLVAELLVDFLGRPSRTLLVALRGDGCELKRERELEVGLGDDLRVLGKDLQFVLERLPSVSDRVGVPVNIC